MMKYVSGPAQCFCSILVAIHLPLIQDLVDEAVASHENLLAKASVGRSAVPFCGSE